MHYIRGNNNKSNVLLSETIKVRRKWNDNFKLLKEKNYLEKLSFKTEGKIKTFLDEEKSRGFISNTLNCKKC